MTFHNPFLLRAPAISYFLRRIQSNPRLQDPLSFPYCLPRGSAFSNFGGLARYPMSPRSAPWIVMLKLGRLAADLVRSRITNSVSPKPISSPILCNSHQSSQAFPGEVFCLRSSFTPYSTFANRLKHGPCHDVMILTTRPPHQNLNNLCTKRGFNPCPPLPSSPSLSIA